MEYKNLLPDADDLSVTDYLALLRESDSKPLSAEEEVELSKRIQQGDDEARNRLVEANLRFVISVAKWFQGRGLPLLDLISAGNLGLLTAAERFDGTRGYKFISYAVWWIKQAILQALAEHARTVRLPLNKIALLGDISKAARRLAQGHEVEPTAEQIATALEMSEEEIEQTMLDGRSACSLDAVFADDDERNLLTHLTDPNQPLPDVAVAGQSSTAVMNRILGCLNKRERHVIDRYYGLDGEEAEILDQIGARMGLTRERVRQIREMALQKLRHPSRAEAWQEVTGTDLPGRSNGQTFYPKTLEPAQAAHILAIYNALQAELGEPPTIEEVAYESGEPEWAVRIVYKLHHLQ